MGESCNRVSLLIIRNMLTGAYQQARRNLPHGGHPRESVCLHPTQITYLQIIDAMIGNFQWDG